MSERAIAEFRRCLEARIADLEKAIEEHQETKEIYADLLVLLDQCLEVERKK
jgi:hypothetical protein